MAKNEYIGKTFVNIRDILTDAEKAQLAIMWKKGGFHKTAAGIDIFLRNNLVECIQLRRMEPRPGFIKTRHMLCTRNFWMAKKLAKLRGLQMKIIKKRPKVWYTSRKLLLTWDIVMNDWRMIDIQNLKKWRLLDFVPFTSEDHFKKVANIWTTNFKKIKYPDGAGMRTYCNYIRRGI